MIQSSRLRSHFHRPLGFREAHALVDEYDLNRNGVFSLKEKRKLKQDLVASGKTFTAPATTVLDVFLNPVHVKWDFTDSYTSNGYVIEKIAASNR